MRRNLALLALLCASPGTAMGQEAATVAATSAQADTAPVQPDSSRPRAVWVAGLSAGMLDRDEGASSPYGTASLTRYEGNSYLRLAFTGYRSTFEQFDAALPSTYYIGSVGAGGNWNGWVADAYVSFGLQDYGLIETAAGKRKSNAGESSPYVAAGLRLGHIFEPVPGWYVTPLAGLQYAKAKSLRHRLDPAGPQDFELRERSLTGSASLRIDYALGSDRQDYLGLSLTHFESDNGLTSWELPSFAFSSSPKAVGTPDSWQEIGASTTLRLSPNLWLDGQAQRSFGAVAGDSTTLSLGLRWRL